MPFANPKSLFHCSSSASCSHLWFYLTFLLSRDRLIPLFHLLSILKYASQSISTLDFYHHRNDVIFHCFPLEIWAAHLSNHITSKSSTISMPRKLYQLYISVLFTLPRLPSGTAVPPSTFLICPFPLSSYKNPYIPYKI